MNKIKLSFIIFLVTTIALCGCGGKAEKQEEVSQTQETDISEGITVVDQYDNIMYLWNELATAEHTLDEWDAILSEITSNKKETDYGFQWSDGDNVIADWTFTYEKEEAGYGFDLDVYCQDGLEDELSAKTDEAGFEWIDDGYCKMYSPSEEKSYTLRIVKGEYAASANLKLWYFNMDYVPEELKELEEQEEVEASEENKTEALVIDEAFLEQFIMDILNTECTLEGWDAKMLEIAQIEREEFMSGIQGWQYPSRLGLTDGDKACVNMAYHDELLNEDPFFESYVRIITDDVEADKEKIKEFLNASGLEVYEDAFGSMIFEVKEGESSNDTIKSVLASFDFWKASIDVTFKIIPN